MHDVKIHEKNQKGTFCSSVLERFLEMPAVIDFFNLIICPILIKDIQCRCILS